MIIAVEILQEIIENLPDVNSRSIEIGQQHHVPIHEPITIQKTFSPTTKVKGKDLIFVKAMHINGYRWFLEV